MVIFRRSFIIDFLRTLLRSKMRFLSILAIIALGVGFYAGINATQPNMVLSADKYYQEQNLADFRIISPLGIKQDDIRQVLQLPGIEQAYPGYTQDLFLVAEDGTRSTARLISVASRDEDSNALNRPIVVEGRLPAAADEIVIDNGLKVPDSVVIGSLLTAVLPAEGSVADVLQESVFKVVGFAISPLFINIDRGQTSIGDGSVDFFAYIPQESFALESFTDISLRTADSLRLTAYTPEYDQHLLPLKTQIEALGESIIAAETEKMREDIGRGKSELEAGKADAEAKLAEAAASLDNAEAELEQGEAELIQKEEEYRQEITDGRLELAEGRRELDKGRILYFSSYITWLQGYNQYQDGRDELSTARARLDNARLQIEQAERDLDAAGQQLAAARALLDRMQELITILQNTQQVLSAGADIDEAQLRLLIDEIRVYAPDLAQELENYSADPDADESLLKSLISTVLSWLEDEYAAANAEYLEGMAEYEAGRKKLAASRIEYEDGLADYHQGMEQLEAAKAELDQGRLELDAAQLEIEAGEARIAAGESELEQAESRLERELDQGRSELEAARRDLEAARIQFNQERQSVMAEISRAEADIREAERQLLEIPQQWFVLTRDDNPGYADYGADARRIGAVARIFPLFFFLVAALVCFTTMTRMIEEERIQVGTMKALGYGSMAIASKYMAYALSASMIGSVIGLLFGFNTFPRSIMNAYGLLYEIPYVLAPFHINYAAFSIFVALLTVFLAMTASVRELRSTPAILMQPRAPKPGKRILLEKIEPLWSRLSFSHKLAARNIFRYKQRLMMTVIGIAGCTALLLTGFGLKDSINAIIGKQFDDIFIYDGQLMIDTEQPAAEAAMTELLAEHKDITSYQKTHMESISITSFSSGSAHSASLLVVEDPPSISDFIFLQERESRKPLHLGNDGAIITEKLSELIQADQGDSIVFRDADNRTYTIRIAGIAENYLTHYVYMSPDYFEQVTYRQPVYNGAVFNLENPQNIDQSAFQEDLLTRDFVLGSMLTLEISSEFGNTLDSLNYVVLILIISAGALAFVVLYNLININITERIREIATIKVLGFRDREVSMYVFREIMVLTVIGTVAGLFLGILLHRFVMNTMEVDNMMFGKEINLLSYIFSIALTMLFSVLVNVTMHYKLRRIKLAESLKSVE